MDQTILSEVLTFQGIVALVLDQTGQITGEDLGELQGKADDLFERIKADPIWKDLADEALREVNKLTTPSGSGALIPTGVGSDG